MTGGFISGVEIVGDTKFCTAWASVSVVGTIIVGAGVETGLYTGGINVVVGDADELPGEITVPGSEALVAVGGKILELC